MSLIPRKLHRSLLVALLGAALVMPDADARVGRGRSYGRSYSTRRAVPPPIQPRHAGRSPGLGSMLASGLAGGFLGSMLFRGMSGSAYGPGMGFGPDAGYGPNWGYGPGASGLRGSGFGFFDLLVLGALGWWLLSRLKRRRREESLFSSRGHSRDAPSPVVPIHSVDITQGRDAARWSRHREHWIERFMTIQSAWSRGELESVRRLMEPGLYLELSTDLQRLKREGMENRLENVVIREAEPVDSWQTGEEGDGPENEFVTVHFIGSSRDYDVERGTGRVVSGDPRGHVDFDEFWTFRRSGVSRAMSRLEAVPWVVTTIQRGEHDGSAPRLASLY